MTRKEFLAMGIATPLAVVFGFKNKAAMTANKLFNASHKLDALDIPEDERILYLNDGQNKVTIERGLITELS